MNKSAELSPILSPNAASKSVLVAGCGYVGMRAARVLRSPGIATFAITRSVEKARRLEAEGLKPVILDLGSSSPWPPLPDVDVVLWSVGFDRSPGANRQATWVDGLTRLLKALPSRTSPRRIIYTSSTGVYGDGEGRDVDELTAPNPNTEGGVACVAAEQVLRQFAMDSGTRVSILRLAGIYGPDRLLRRVSELRQSIPLTTVPDEWLNLIHVDDAVRVINFIASHSFTQADSLADQDGVSVMNVVAAKSVTRRTYYSTLAKVVGAPEPIFSVEGSTNDVSVTGRRRGGNRRVVSRVLESLPILYQFDDCETGLRHAVAESRDSLER